MKWIKLMMSVTLGLLIASCNRYEYKTKTYDLNEVIATASTTLHRITFEGIPVPTTSLEGEVACTDLYGVQVYFRPVEGDNVYLPYAHGLFNNLSQLDIQLLDNHEYAIISTMIANGMRVVAHDKETRSYWNPFITQMATPLNNTFSYSIEVEMKGLRHSQTMMTNEEQHNQLYDCPPVDRYYGELLDIKPLSSTLIIPCQRVSFDAHFTLEGEAPQGFKVMVQGAPILHQSTQQGNICHIHSSFTYPEDAHLSEAWMHPNYTRKLSTTLVWKNKKGIEEQSHRNIEYNPLAELIH